MALLPWSPLPLSRLLWFWSLSTRSRYVLSYFMHMSILLAQAEFCSILGTNISSFKNICVFILAPETLCLVSKKSLSPQPSRPGHLSEVPFPADAPRLHSTLVSTTWFSVKTANVPLSTMLFPTRTTGSSKSLMPAFNEHYCQGTGH